MRKNRPYIVILVFSIANAVIRYALIPQWNWKEQLGSFILQLVVLFAIWFIIKSLNSLYDKLMPFNKGVAKRIFVQFASSLLFTFPLLIAVNIISEKYFTHLDFMGKEFKALVGMLFVIVILLVNFSFYGLYFFRQWKLSIEEKARLQVQAADTQKEKSMMQYQHLKNQVNPHFLFNTLTSLDGLILSEPALASQFVRHLAKVYRYVLEHQENEIVSLQTEIDFIQHYISILKIKHDNAVVIQVDVSEAARDKGIAMVSLQMLIDNAIKHNIVQAKAPLHITIKDKDGWLMIKNNLQLRKQIETSTKQGLQHLRQLYSFITDRPVTINNNNNFFEVKLPLL